jgi:hypothetical protein
MFDTLLVVVVVGMLEDAEELEEEPLVDPKKTRPCLS